MDDERHGMLAGPIDGQPTITTMTRVREVEVPKWEKIDDVEMFENWQHIVHTNLHSSANVEDDAETVINRIADVGVPNDELRFGMSIGQTQLDMELYRGVIGALSGTNTDAKLAMARIRRECKIGRGMHATRILQDQLGDMELEGTRKKTEAFTRLIQMQLRSNADLDACRVFLSDLHDAQADSKCGDEMALEMLQAKIQQVHELKAPYSAWVAQPGGTYSTLRHGLEQYVKAMAKQETTQDAYLGYVPRGPKGRRKGKGKGGKNGEGKGDDHSTYGSEAWKGQEGQESAKGGIRSWDVPE